MVAPLWYILVDSTLPLHRKEPSDGGSEPEGHGVENQWKDVLSNMEKTTVQSRVPWLNRPPERDWVKNPTYDQWYDYLTSTDPYRWMHDVWEFVQADGGPTPYSPETCWVWLGNISARGYPRVRVETRAEYVRHLIYKVLNDLPMDAKVPYISNTCRDKQCVRPAHLMRADRTQRRRNQQAIAAAVRRGLRVEERMRGRGRKS